MNTSGCFWYHPVTLRKLMFDVRYGTKLVDDGKPKGCVWNRYKLAPRKRESLRKLRRYLRLEEE